MKFKAFEHQIYERNPLIEVVCQIRFERISELENESPSKFENGVIAKKYPVRNVESPVTIQLSGIVQNEVPLQPEITSMKVPNVYHFITSDGFKKISFSADFFAFSSTKYLNWADFKLDLIEAFTEFSAVYRPISISRLGLRYKDLIERESLGLEGTSWNDLLSPFISGYLAASEVFDATEGFESKISHQAHQTVFKFDDCDVMIQSALLVANDDSNKQAFLIDADFFSDKRHGSDEPVSVVLSELDLLHNGVYDMFRHCIKDKLHYALRPRLG